MSGLSSDLDSSELESELRVRAAQAQSLFG
jgi:hypothetical protein